MPCTQKQRGFFFFLASKKRKTKKDKVTMKGLAKKCEFKHKHQGGDRKMVKRRKKCRARTVMVGRNRCAKISCRGKVLKGRVKCGRKKVAGRSRRAKVYVKSRRRICKFGHRKGTKVCRKHPKRVIRVKARRSYARKAKRTGRRKVQCGKKHSKCGKTHRKNPRHSGRYPGAYPVYH